MNHKLSAVAMLAVILATASSLLGFPTWLKIMIMIFAVFLVLTEIIVNGRWVIRKNLDFSRKAQGTEKSEHELNESKRPKT